jgi:hypothetical protein
LAARRASGLDVYGRLGSLATYGFVAAHGLVCAALPSYLRGHGAFHAAARIITPLACLAKVLAMVGNVYPVPEGPYGKLPFICLAYLTSGLLWYVLFVRSRTTAAK